MPYMTLQSPFDTSIQKKYNQYQMRLAIAKPASISGEESTFRKGVQRYAYSSYFYRKKADKRGEFYADAKEQIRAIFEGNYSCYGYRRIYLALKKSGVRLSEKVIRRLMKQEHLQPRVSKKRVYSSYRGEITPAVPNVIQRNFHADCPNEKWLTDITEFSIPAGKVYLSPMIDCFDGMPVSWRIGVSPSGELVNGMLDDAIIVLSAREKPTIHTDRGCHYAGRVGFSE